MIIRLFRISLVVLLSLIVAACTVQWFDLASDRAIPNIITLVCGGLVYLLLLGWLFVWLARSTGKTLAILVVAIIVAAPSTMFRLKGFTGEVIPILERRFRNAPALQSVVKPQPRGSNEVLTAYNQFLGPQRNAIIERRDFEIPKAGEFEEVWRIPVGSAWSSVLIVDQVCVTMEQRGANEAVTCYDLSDGKLLWMHEVAAKHFNALGGLGPRATPTVIDGRVYSQGATGIVRCNDLSTGELVWQQDLLKLADWTQAESEGAITWGRSGSPLVVDDLCVVPFGRSGKSNADPRLAHGSLIAFDKSTGEVRWTAGDDQISYASPVMMELSGARQIVSVNESSVTGHEPATGEQLWSIDWPGTTNGTGNCSCALQLAEDQLFIAKGYSIGCGVFSVTQTEDSWITHEQWTDKRLLKTKFTHACLDGSVAYGLSDGILECVDLSKPKRLWTQPRGNRYGHGQALRVEDCLVVQTETGEIVLVACDTSEFRVLATIPALTSKTWNVPTVAGRYLLARNDLEAVLYRLPERKIAVE